MALEKLLWQAYLCLESYMELRRPFNPLQHYLRDPLGAQALKPIAPLVIPPNAPPPVVQGLWQAAAQQAMQGLAAAAVEVDYAVVNAVLESVRVASEFRTAGKVSAFRNMNGEIQISGTDTDSGWRRVDAPAPECASAES